MSLVAHLRQILPLHSEVFDTLSKPLSMFGLRARPRSALIASKVRQIQNLVLPDTPGM